MKTIYEELTTEEIQNEIKSTYNLTLKKLNTFSSDSIISAIQSLCHHLPKILEGEQKTGAVIPFVFQGNIKDEADTDQAREAAEEEQVIGCIFAIKVGKNAATEQAPTYNNGDYRFHIISTNGDCAKKSFCKFNPSITEVDSDSALKRMMLGTLPNVINIDLQLASNFLEDEQISDNRRTKEEQKDQDFFMKTSSKYNSPRGYITPTEFNQEKLTQEAIRYLPSDNNLTNSDIIPTDPINNEAQHSSPLPSAVPFKKRLRKFTWSEWWSYHKKNIQIHRMQFVEPSKISTAHDEIDRDNGKTNLAAALERTCNEYDCIWKDYKPFLAWGSPAQPTINSATTRPSSEKLKGIHNEAEENTFETVFQQVINFIKNNATGKWRPGKLKPNGSKDQPEYCTNNRPSIKHLLIKNLLTIGLQYQPHDYTKKIALTTNEFKTKEYPKVVYHINFFKSLNKYDLNGLLTFIENGFIEKYGLNPVREQNKENRETTTIQSRHPFATSLR